MDEMKRPTDQHDAAMLSRRTVLVAAVAAAVGVGASRLVVAAKEGAPAASGATSPSTPTGSCIASVTPRTGTWWIAPSHLSAQAA